MAINPLAIGGGVVAAAAVVGGGLYAGGVFSGGSSNTPQRGVVDAPKPTQAWRALSKDKDFTSAYGTDAEAKYGKTYGRFLLGVTKQDTEATDSNDAWWTWIFKNVYSKSQNKTKAKGKFKGLEKALGETDSLQAICKAAYGEKVGTGTEKIKTTADAITNDQFLEDNIWLFCSLAKAKIKTVKDSGKADTYTANTEADKKYGKKYESQLVEIDGNDLFWNERLDDLKAADSNPATTNSLFHISNHKDMTLQHLKDKCKASYSEKEENNTQYPKADVAKFCSLSGKDFS